MRDDNCKDGKVCVDRKCVGCRDDNSCPPDQTCLATGECGSCTEDSHCGGGRTCEDGKCVGGEVTGTGGCCGNGRPTFYFNFIKKCCAPT